MRYLLLCSFCLALAGCKTPQELAQQVSQQDHATCMSYGVWPSSPAYYDCRMRTNEMRAVQQAQANQAMANFGAQLMEAGKTRTY
jgi:hypothetical protein